MTFSRVYIAGSGGMLGAAVYAHFKDIAEVRASDLSPRESWLRTVDVGAYDQFYDDVADFGPDLLINLAAQTDLEFCEHNPDFAWHCNALGAENGGLIANQLDIPYVYISTAGIFGGERATYLDYHEPNPLTVYAQSKFYGERFVERAVRKYFVLRAGWMMGGGPSLDKKFINKLYSQLVAGERKLYAVTDKLGTPTYTKDFARGIEVVASSGLYGVYNQVCSGLGSRYDVARHFVTCLGLDDSVEVVPVESSHFATEYFAERPASEQLLNAKLSSRGINVMRDWREALADYSEEFPTEGLRR